MNAGVSDFVPVRGLRYHLRCRGAPDAPLLILAHGWMDLSATFDPVAEVLAAGGLRVLVPDWRGFGLTGWPPDGYWFPDYVADLEALVHHYAGDSAPVMLAGHSMGAQIVSLYAGLRPQRVRRLAILDGLFLPDGNSADAPRRYRNWLDAVGQVPAVPEYAGFAELAQRVRKRHPRLDAAGADFVARCWGRQDADGRVRLQSDPRHLLTMPRGYRQDESDAVWAGVTAPTLFIDGAESAFARGLPEDEKRRRRALFPVAGEQVLPGAGHMLHFDAPQELARRLLDFFTR